MFRSGAGETWLDGYETPAPAPCALSIGKIVAIVGNKMEIWISCKYFLYSLCTNDVPLSTRWRAFAWDRQADRGAKPLHDHIYTHHKRVSMRHHARKENARTADQGRLLSSPKLLRFAISP